MAHHVGSSTSGEFHDEDSDGNQQKPEELRRSERHVVEVATLLGRLLAAMVREDPALVDPR